MRFNAVAIANYFYDLCAAQGQRLTPMKLQKLVYLAHGWHLGLTGKPLLDEEIQAWSFGPVVRSVYNAFQEFGADEITSVRGEYVSGPSDGASPFCAIYRIPTLDDYPPLETAKIRPLLDRIWAVYGGYSAIQLSNMTHEPGTPWHRVFLHYNKQIPKYATIPDEWIKEYFEQQRKQG
jgi:uncharacterized phage-associated protein